jgi:hypothetical protein
MWSTRRLNDMDPYLRFAMPRCRRDGIPAQLVISDFRAGREIILELRPAGGVVVESLGVLLPCR